MNSVTSVIHSLNITFPEVNLEIFINHVLISMKGNEETIA